MLGSKYAHGNVPFELVRQAFLPAFLARPRARHEVLRLGAIVCVRVCGCVCVCRDLNVY